MASDWLNLPVVAASVGALLNLILVIVAVSALSAWRREKDFTIARNLYISLFEFDREAHALKDRLMFVTLAVIGDLESGAPAHVVDLSQSFGMLREKAWAFQSALVEASGRWQSDFGLSPIGLFLTDGIEFRLHKMREVLKTAVREEDQFRTRSLDERNKRAGELTQQYMQLHGECGDVLRREWERFHDALSPRFKKHFSVRAARLGRGDVQDRK